MDDVNEKIEKLTEDTEKVSKFLLDPEIWTNFGWMMLRVLIIILLASIVVRIGKVLIRRFFKLKFKGPIRKSERRENTLLKLLENALTYVVYFSAILAVLSEFSIDVKGLLAGAGILGLAIGFGAQNLVKDIITGFFIIFEDQFSVGDIVQIGNAIGTVEEIGLRTTKVVANGGEVHIIPNGSIVEVINYSLRNSLAIIDVGIAYETDVNRAEQMIQQFLNSLPDKYEELVGVPKLLGIQNLGTSDVILRITAETKPTMNHAVARKLRKDLKQFMDDNGIEIPYPKMVLYQGCETE